MESKWGIQLSYDYSRKLIKVASVMENSIFRTQLRVNDELVKLNGVDPALRFRDIKDLYAFMSKALSINLTVKRPFSNEGKDYLPIDAFDSCRDDGSQRRSVVRNVLLGKLDA